MGLGVIFPPFCFNHCVFLEVRLTPPVSEMVITSLREDQDVPPIG